MKPLDGGIAKLLKKGLSSAKMTFPVALLKITLGGRTPGNESGGRSQTTTSYPGRGFVPKKTATKIGGTLVEQNDRIVAVLGASLASGIYPTTKDKMAIDGETLRIMGVETEAAKAVYTCLCRK